MSLKILLVDNQEEERKTIGEVFRQEPAFEHFALRLLEAPDGQAAMEIFEQEQPDLIITDLLMPKSDGFFLCHALRNHPQGKELPLIVISGLYNDVAVTQKLRNHFGAEILSKPILPRRLIGKSLELLNRYRTNHPDVDQHWFVSTMTFPDFQAYANMDSEDTNLPEEKNSSTPLPIIVSNPADNIVDAKDKMSPTPIKISLPSIDLSHALKGALNQIPLARLLICAVSKEVTGALKLSRGKVRKVIYLIQGKPIYVDSNLRNETLGAYLVTTGMLNDEQLAKAIQQARANSKKLGETLIFMGLATEQTILTGLQGQVRLKLISALRWPDGFFSWTPGDDFSHLVPHCTVEPVELVLSALKKFTRADDLSGSLTPVLDQALVLTDIGKRFQKSIERVFGSSSLRKAIASPSLRQTLSSDLDLPALLVQIEALRITGLAEFTISDGEDSPSAFIPASPSVSSEPTLATSASAEQAPDRTAELGLDLLESPPHPDLESQGSTRTLLELSDLAPSRPKTKSAAITIEEVDMLDPDSSGPPLHAQGEDSQPTILTSAPLKEISIKAEDASISNAPVSDSGESGFVPDSVPSTTELTEQLSAEIVPEQFKTLLLQTYLGIHDKDFYQILNVDPQADTAEVEEAYQSIRQYFSIPNLEKANLDLERDKLEELNAIFDQAYNILHDSTKRQTYDATLAMAQTQPLVGPDAFGAELQFREGQSFLGKKEFSEAVKAFHCAVLANANQPDYHAFLGWALFLNEGRGETGATAARHHLEQALRIAPDSFQSHELAGWIERDARNYETAAEHFIRALALGSPRLDLFDIIKELLVRLERYEELERQYRHLIFRLRENAPLDTVPLWVDLAYLYAQHLNRPDNAKIALQVASKMAPSDPLVTKAIEELNSAEKTAWRNIVEKCRQRLRVNSEDVSPLHELFALHRAEDRSTQALNAATWLVHLGASNEEEYRYYHEHAMKGILRTSRTINSSMREQLRVPEDSSIIEELVACLSPLLSWLFPVTLEDLGSSEIRLLSETNLPQSFRGICNYVSQILEEPLPALFQSETLGVECVPVPGEERQLVIGHELIKASDEARVAFALARALSCISRGRRHLYTRRVSEFREAILATLSFFKTEIQAPDPEGKIAAFKAALGASAINKNHLGDLVNQLVQQGKLNLSEWRRAVRQSSSRVGILLCNDLRVGLIALRDEPEIIPQFMDFTLGENYPEIVNLFRDSNYSGSHLK